MSSVAVIGGGITGLTAAYRLRQKGVDVTLYEAGGRVGGPIQSVSRDGFLAEFGPNSLLETSPLITNLIRDLGLEGRRLYSNPEAEKRYTVRGKQLMALPATAGDFLRSRLFSTRAKLRLALEPFIPPARADLDESIGSFVRRRLGREFLDYAINPFVAGIYAGDPDLISVRHAFPKLHKLEQRYRSLLVGQYLGARERKRTGEVSKQDAKKISFDKGLQVLTDSLRDDLSTVVHLNSPVHGLRRTKTGWAVAFQVGHDGIPNIEEHSAVLLAVPAHRLAQVKIEGVPGVSLTALGEVPHPPVSSIVLGFRREDVAHPLDGFGMLIPAVERFNTLGTLFSSTLFSNRAPAGHVTLTSYLGGTRAPALARQPLDVQVEATLQDLRELLGVKGRPVFQHHANFPKAIPQYNVGFGQSKELMNETESKAPGVFVAGHCRDGISLGDSIVAGHRVAERINHFLSRGVASEGILHHVGH